MDDKRLERVEKKIDLISDRLGNIDVTLGSQHVSLKDHMRRTAALEESLKPIQRHVNMVDGALKLVGLLSLILGMIVAIKMVVK